LIIFFDQSRLESQGEMSPEKRKPRKNRQSPGRQESAIRNPSKKEFLFDVEKELEKAIQNESIDPDYYNDLGYALQDQGKLDEAIACYQKALQIKPDSVAAYFNLGSAFQDQGKLNDAICYYQKTLELRPDMAGAYINLGNAFQTQGKLDEAIACYQKALQIKPDSVAAYFNLGSAFQDQGELDKAILCYKSALQHQSDAGIEVKTCLALPVISRSKEAITRSRRILIEKIENLREKGLSLEDPNEQVGSTHFLLAYHGLNDKEIQKKIASFYIHTCPGLARSFSPRTKTHRIGDRIRLGIISRHLFDHTIGNINHGIIKQLSREKFHVKLFRFPGEEDHLSKDIDSSADDVVILPTKLKSARKKIAGHPLDILFYLDIGMEPLTYFLAFSRLAPVQCVTWGHPVTTGIPNIDYYISSETAEPPCAQDHYSEQLVQLKRLVMYCYRPEMDEKIPPQAKFGFSEDHKLYVCPQTLFKLHPDFDEILGAILRRDSHGLLVLFQGRYKHWERLWLDRFAHTFPDEVSRVRFLPRMSKKEYLSFLRVADVLLDTLHFSGGYTSLLSFACGVPVVTWPGTLMRGRLTLALYKQMGVLDCVANDVHSYIDIAFRLANDKMWADEVRTKIKARAGVLFEDNEVLHELESFFENAVQEGP
jgi:protein O-GlcNAc transferase